MTSSPPVDSITFWELVERAATTHPDRVLFRDDYGRSLTARQYKDQAEQVAAGIRVAPGDRVSWQLPTVLEAPVLLAALARLGAVQNPIITILRAREIGLINALHQPDLVIVPETWRGFGHGTMARQLDGPRVLTIDMDARPGSELRLPAGDPTSLPQPPDDATAHRWTYFSSGTTADQKGVRHTDASVIAGSNGMTDHLLIREGDVYPIAWPYAHIGGAAMTATVLRTGGTMVLFDTFDRETPIRMAAHRPTILGSAVPFFRAYLDAQRAHGARPLYGNLRMFTAGGAPTPPDLIQDLIDTFGVQGLQDAWGLTEFPIATSSLIGDPSEKLLGTAGRPCAGVEVRVVDGELHLKGPQCFLGYVDGQLDRDAFDADGWFRTGDLGSIDDEGYVTISGRIKDVIIRNAENISSVEVETILAQHPDIVEVAVLGIPDRSTGEKVCAMVVARPGRTVSLDAAAAHCVAMGLARQKIPERIEMMASLPRNAMGKVLKQELRSTLGQ